MHATQLYLKIISGNLVATISTSPPHLSPATVHQAAGRGALGSAHFNTVCTVKYTSMYKRWSLYPSSGYLVKRLHSIH
jgi:hypothetical protein